MQCSVCLGEMEKNAQLWHSCCARWGFSVWLGFYLNSELKSTPSTHPGLPHHLAQGQIPTNSSQFCLLLSASAIWFFYCFFFLFLFSCYYFPCLVKRTTNILKDLPSFHDSLLHRRYQVWKNFQSPKIYCNQFLQVPLVVLFFQISLT